MDEGLIRAVWRHGETGERKDGLWPQKVQNGMLNCVCVSVCTCVPVCVCLSVYDVSMCASLPIKASSWSTT